MSYPWDEPEEWEVYEHPYYQQALKDVVIELQKLLYEEEDTPILDRGIRLSIRTVKEMIL